MEEPTWRAGNMFCWSEVVVRAIFELAEGGPIWMRVRWGLTGMVKDDEGKGRFEPRCDEIPATCEDLHEGFVLMLAMMEGMEVMVLRAEISRLLRERKRATESCGLTQTKRLTVKVSASTSVF